MTDRSLTAQPAVKNAIDNQVTRQANEAIAVRMGISLQGWIVQEMGSTPNIALFYGAIAAGTILRGQRKSGGSDIPASVENSKSDVYDDLSGAGLWANREMWDGLRFVPIQTPERMSG
jgi:hypothetical protein